MLPSNYKLYFDLDNTLYSHEQAFERTMLEGYKQLAQGWQAEKLNIPHILAEEWFSKFKHYCDLMWEEYENQELKREEYQRLRYMKSMQHYGLPARVKEAERLQAYYIDNMHRFVTPFLGLEKLLTLLQEHQVEVGIITNGQAEVQLRKWDKLQLGRYLDIHRLYISEKIGLSKPDPAIFNYVSGIEEASSYIYVGDAWEFDILPAINAGWQAIYLHTVKYQKSSPAKPLFTCDSLDKLRPFLSSFLFSDK